jgi:hypothetical protein
MRYFTKRRQRTLKSCEGRAFKVSDNEYRVKNYTVYKSHRKGWLCECKHFVYKQTPCSHIVYVTTRFANRETTHLMRSEVDHVTNRSDKVVLGKTNEMNLVGMMVMVSVMSMPPVMASHKRRSP